MMADSTPNVELHTSNDVLGNRIDPAYAVSTQTIAGPEPKARSSQQQPKTMKEALTAKPDRVRPSSGDAVEKPIIRSHRDKRKEKRGRRRRNRAQQLNDYNERLVAQHTHDEIRIQHLKRHIKSRWLQDAEFLASRLSSRAPSV
ncbi:hypothetical protein N7460_012283 [Penicillium canescens]|uniref:Uncharacterized protein n=2 Tax=Penicillium canescens TaxID=5083 RepID=A0AAD6I256_PENCN|nr:hypothetical protein N7460_012283 [Penicillium canescens]KAJ6040740.1 hypothetical protein N7444_009645 [Penicillium canescens]